MADKKDEYKDVKVGKNLVGRIYRSGKVVIGFKCEKDDKLNPMKMEAEVTLNFTEARSFTEALTGMINIMDGRY